MLCTFDLSNQGTTKRFHEISELDLYLEKGRPFISIFEGSPRPKPIIIKILEKHPLGSQTFLPVQDYKWLTVVASEINETNVYISTPYPGNTAEDIERFVTDALEEEVKG